ncbi:MAG TPA: amino acid permease [Rhizomicrobium sp.]|jgi:arginine:agmatine antiporter
MNADSRKKIGPVLAMMLVASAMIGSGIFLLPASLGAIGSISILAWIAASFGAALLAGVFCWLAILDPGASGLFSYIRDAFGPGAGFVAGALYWASCVVAIVAVALAVAGYLGVFIPAIAKPPGLAFGTIAAIWIFAGTNILGPRFVAGLQSWALALGLAPVFLAAVGGWLYFHPEVFMASWNVTGGSALSVVPRAAVMVFWAFLGIETAIVLSTRVKNPGRNVPIATLGGLVIAAIIYMAACAAIMGILPASALAKSSAPFADAAAPILGASIAGVFALCAMLKASGTLSATILLTVETAECEAVLGRLGPASPARPAHRVSTANIVFTAALSSLIVWASVSPTLARQFTIVTNVAVVLSLLVYGSASLALLRLSRSLPQSQRLWAWVLGVGGSLFSAALIAVSEPDLLIYSAGSVLASFGAYAVLRARRAQLARAAIGA